MKRFLSVLLALMLTIAFAVPALGAERTARTIEIFKLSGTSAVITKGTIKEFKAKEGQKLHGGYTLATGASTTAHLRLDEESLVKMDQKSKVEVSKLSKTKLSIAVLSGGALVDAAAQKAGDTLEIRAGNSALTVRGTLFIVEYEQDGVFVVTMLQGDADIDGNPLPEGYRMRVYDPEAGGEEERRYEVEQSLIDENMSLFTLQEILENSENLIRDGLLSEEDLGRVNELTEQKAEEQAQKDAENEEALSQLAGQGQGEQQEYLGEPTPSPPSDSGGGSVTPVPRPFIVNGAAYRSLEAAITAAVAAAVNGTPAPISLSQNATLSGTVALGTDSEFTVANGATLTITGTLTLESGATLINNGGIVNNSSNTISIERGATFTNNGTLTNGANGAIKVGVEGTSGTGNLINNGTLTLDGSFTIGADGKLTGEGVMYLKSGGTFDFGAYWLRYKNSSTALVNQSFSNVLQDATEMAQLYEHPIVWSSEFTEPGDYDTGLFVQSFIKNESKNRYYGSITEALTYSVSGDTINITGIVEEGGSLTVPTGVNLNITKEAKVTLSGGTGTCILTNNGNITVKGTLNSVTDFTNYGNITLENGDPNTEFDVKFDNGSDTIYILNKGVFSIKGETNNDRDQLRLNKVVFTADDGSTLSLENGKIEATNTQFIINPGGTISFADGSLELKDNYSTIVGTSGASVSFGLSTGLTITGSWDSAFYPSGIATPLSQPGELYNSTFNWDEIIESGGNYAWIKQN